MPLFHIDHENVSRETTLVYRRKCFFQWENILNLLFLDFVIYIFQCLKVLYMYISFLQGHLKAPQFTFKKEQFYIDDDQIAKELHKLQSILKDESLTEEQAKAYKGKW